MIILRLYNPCQNCSSYNEVGLKSDTFSNLTDIMKVLNLLASFLAVAFAQERCCAPDEFQAFVHVDGSTVSVSEFRVDYNRGAYIFASNRTGQMMASIEINKHDDAQTMQIITDYAAGTEYYIDLLSNTCLVLQQEPNMPFPEQCISETLSYRGSSSVGTGDEAMSVEEWLGFDDFFEDEATYTTETCTPLNEVASYIYPLESAISTTRVTSFTPFVRLATIFDIPEICGSAKATRTTTRRFTRLPKFFTGVDRRPHFDGASKGKANNNARKPNRGLRYRNKAKK